MIPIISNSPASCTGTDALWENPTFEQDFSAQQVSFEWIQSLPAEQKDAALYRLFRTIEARPTLVELFAINQVVYRTVSGNTFTESAESVAERTGCDRKTVLKGLAIAVEQNILEKRDRPGTSTEYSFKPIEEWLPEPVVRIKDIRTKKVLQFPSSHHTESAEDELQVTSTSWVVHNTDDHETDSNTVVVSLKQLEEQQEVSIPATDTPKSPWKYVGQGIGRVYVLPELDADTGLKIESIHSETKEPRQIIVKRAVDLLYKQIAGIPNFIDDQPARVLPQRVGAINAITPNVQGIPEDVFIALQNAGIDLGLSTAERLWVKYSDKFEEAIGYTIAQEQAGKIKQSKEGFFRRSLEEGWNLTIKPQVLEKEVSMASESAKSIDEPSAEEMALIDEAIASGRARDKYYGTHGWLVIRLTGHSESWRDFLYK